MKKVWYGTIHTATSEDGLIYADSKKDAERLLRDAIGDEELFTNKDQFRNQSFELEAGPFEEADESLADFVIKDSKTVQRNSQTIYAVFGCVSTVCLRTPFVVYAETENEVLEKVRRSLIDTYCNNCSNDGLNEKYALYETLTIEKIYKGFNIERALCSFRGFREVPIIFF